MPTTADDGYLRVTDAAAQLGISPRTLREWIRRGVLPGYRLGPRLIQVRRTDVDAIRQRMAGED